MNNPIDASATASKAPRDRSPSFPFIGLPTVIERLEAFEAKFGRHPAPANKAGLAWGMKEGSSQAFQTIAALKSFGMLDYQGSGPTRLTSLTETGRNYLRAQQDNVKRGIVRECALKPKAIAKYWGEWGAKRPIDEICLDQLVLGAAFTQSAADTFLSVYDSTVAYAGLSDSDKESNIGNGDVKGESPPALDIAIGDVVQITVAGIDTLAKPAMVRAIQEHDGQSWVFVEGTETGALMTDVSLIEKNGVAKPMVPPTMPLPLREGAPVAGEGMDRFTVDEGVVKITFPEGMTADSVQELEDFFALFIKKAKRRASKPN